METLVFIMLFVVTVGSAAIVAFSRNLIYSAFALMGTFVGVAGTFILLQAGFLGLAQIMVYAGGILVLTVFAVMLTARMQQEGKTNPTVNYKAVAPIMIGFAILMGSIIKTDKWAVFETSATPLDITTIGNVLLTRYLLPFELISILLLMAMIGAAIITRRYVRNPQDGG
jgi:NAD(P)H-quinone oxidoreductase subunit 6